MAAALIAAMSAAPQRNEMQREIAAISSRGRIYIHVNNNETYQVLLFIPATPPGMGGGAARLSFHPIATEQRMKIERGSQNRFSVVKNRSRVGGGCICWAGVCVGWL
jgi:hypothetical protein